MKTIWKYTVNPADETIFEVPWHTRFFAFQNQAGFMQAWAFVNPEEKRMKTVTLRLVGTGHPIDFPIGETTNRYIGTAQFSGLVFHLFSDDNKDGI